MTRDQFITEKILKECWHEVVSTLGDGLTEPNKLVCSCGKTIPAQVSGYHFINPNFSLWPDKGRLIDEVMGQEWWIDFLLWVGLAAQEVSENIELIKPFITGFPNLVAEYRGWKEEGK